MADVGVEVEAGAVGLDAQRLGRIDRMLAAYVDQGLLPGWSVLVSRRGKVAHLSTYGLRDKEAGLPVEADTLFRIYSMTKPVTSVAAMMLYEDGAFELNDPVSRFIPAFAGARVYRAGSAAAPVTDPLVEPMRIRHLLTHTSGLTYGFHRVHPMDELHRAAGFELRVPEGADLARCCELWAGIPLLFQPGSEWNYSVATDVLGRVVEVASGQTLDAFFRERILGPLGMDDTGFFVPAEDMGRAAALYVPAPGTRKAVRTDQIGVLSPRLPMMLSGGAGLISTIGDYHRFTQMLRGGGQLDGVRLLGPRTVAYMTRNHLPGNAELSQFGRALYAETPLNGVGFGLGFSVVIDPVRYGTLSSLGEYAWGGMASTAFWIDPVEDLTAIFMTQLLPSSTHPVRSQLRRAVYQAVIA